jgi:hypothetical protein
MHLSTLGLRPHMIRYSSTSTGGSGILHSILHGVGDKNELLQGTHALRLGKQNAIFELQFHHVKPKARESYISLIKERFPLLYGQSASSKGLIPGATWMGSWATTIGEQDRFMHVFQYSGYSGYDQVYNATMGSKANTLNEWAKYERDCFPMLKNRSNHICQEFSFLGSKQESLPKSGIYEFRSYQLKPGNLIEWSTFWSEGLRTKKRESNNIVGAWFSQLGSLYHVHHMWYFEDLHSRRVLRDKLWKDENWTESVANTVAFIDRMDAQVLQLLASPN